MKCYNCDSKQLVCDVERDCYICKNCGYQFPKQYFFISHSHKDIEKVRIVRNVIEETFFYEPILFFLKCLSDENEINDLIKREIYERIWFVYCKSENAEKSKYVQFERQYIDSLVKGGKNIKILEVDLDKYEIWDDSCLDYIRGQIEYKIKKTKLFISYSRADYSVACSLSEHFNYNGFNTFMDTCVVGGEIWFNKINQEIKNASYKNGVFLAICSADSLNSKSFLNEVQSAFEHDAFVIPVIYDKTGENFEFLTERLCSIFPFNKSNVFVLNGEDIKSKMQDLCNYLLNY